MKSNRPKPRYNKFVAYILMNFSTAGIICLVFFIMSLFKIEYQAYFIEMLVASVICIVLTFLCTLFINSRTPKSERVKTWFQAWWLGFKIAFKIAFCTTLFLIPLGLKIHTHVNRPSQLDSEGSVIYGDDGNKYLVVDSGNHVCDEAQNWYQVYQDSSALQYIERYGSRVYLRQN